jgi:hypothetical protein
MKSSFGSEASGCRPDRSAQRFLNLHAAVYDTFNVQRHLISRLKLRIFGEDATKQRQIATLAA